MTSPLQTPLPPYCTYRNGGYYHYHALIAASCAIWDCICQVIKKSPHQLILTKSAYKWRKLRPALNIKSCNLSKLHIILNPSIVSHLTQQNSRRSFQDTNFQKAVTRIQNWSTFDCYVSTHSQKNKHVVIVYCIVTAHIAANRGSFNRVCQVAPIFPSNTWFLRPTESAPNGISSVLPFLQCSPVWTTHRQTDTQTTLRHDMRIEIGRI